MRALRSRDPWRGLRTCLPPIFEWAPSSRGSPERCTRASMLSTQTGHGSCVPSEMPQARPGRTGNRRYSRFSCRVSMIRTARHVGPAAKSSRNSLLKRRFGWIATAPMWSSQLQKSCFQGSFAETRCFSRRSTAVDRQPWFNPRWYFLAGRMLHSGTSRVYTANTTICSTEPAV